MRAKQTNRIVKLHILEENSVVYPNHMERERETALKDLMQDSHFQPLNDNNGPYEVALSIEESRLVLRMKNAIDQELSILVLSLRPYRRIMQDYFMMISSYEQARKSSTQEKLEAIDMGRRGLHNEGAELLMERLKDKIDMDFDTARRFFTLICSLHRTGIRLSI
jgi:uncharacterized protein (UPF0262 family)